MDIRLQRRDVRVPIENNWEFSAASAGQQAGALLLGAVNVIGVLTLTTMLGDPYSKLALVREGFGFLLNLLPALQVRLLGLSMASFFVMVLQLMVLQSCCKPGCPGWSSGTAAQCPGTCRSPPTAQRKACCLLFDVMSMYTYAVATPC